MKTPLLIALMGCLIFTVAARGASDMSETINNLKSAYQDEANAHERYTLFAKKADEEGFHQVAKLFRAASRSEQVHRDNHKAAVEELNAKVDRIVPARMIVDTTRNNLESALKDESHERDTMYPEFIKKAKAAGTPSPQFAHLSSPRQEKPPTQNSTRTLWLTLEKMRQSTIMFARFVEILLQRLPTKSALSVDLQRTNT